MAAPISSAFNGNTPVGGASFGGGRAQNRQAQAQPSAALVKPPQAHENYIPSPDSMQTLIGNATNALKQGSCWERGSILNLLV